MTVSENVPGLAEAAAVRAKVDATLPPSGGVTGLGVKEAVTPAGSPETVMLTAALKSPTLATVVVTEPLSPGAIVSAAGDSVILKSAGGGWPPSSEKSGRFGDPAPGLVTCGPRPPRGPGEGRCGQGLRPLRPKGSGGLQRGPTRSGVLAGELKSAQVQVKVREKRS